jgi:hypothetical protein
MLLSAANASWSPPLCLTMHSGDFTIDTIDINWMLNFNKLFHQSRNFRRQNTLVVSYVNQDTKAKHQKQL